uniref:DUF3068 domain-containing protein n=1 Tax=Globodera pallida TaxID=36090 RepID=A0A183CGA8_GLOPA
MQLNAKMIGAGVAAAVAAGIGYALLHKPEDEARFSTVTRDGAISVRDYPGLLVAEVVVPGLRQAALSVGFTRLADYVFGKGRGGGRLPMTVPVLSDGDEDGRGWRTRFLMPADARIDSLPDPRRASCCDPCRRAGSPRCASPGRTARTRLTAARPSCAPGSAATD